MPQDAPDAEGRAALALLDGLIAVLTDKGALSPQERTALLATVMDRLQNGSDPDSLAALAVLQRRYVAE